MTDLKLNQLECPARVGEQRSSNSLGGKAYLSFVQVSWNRVSCFASECFPAPGTRLSISRI